MNGFVNDCRSEWKRLGVPDVVANEMAADLTADLAEAEADGVSPEEVLGNGVFDARSFAASWAAARGVTAAPPARRIAWRRPWVAAVAAAVSLLVMVLGVAALGPFQRMSVAVAAVHRSIVVPFPGVIAGPGRMNVVGPGVFVHSGIGNGPLRALGLLLLVIGVAGLAVSLWLWRSRSRRPGPPGIDDSVRLPSYL